MVSNLTWQPVKVEEGTDLLRFTFDAEMYLGKPAFFAVPIFGPDQEFIKNEIYWGYVDEDGYICDDLAGSMDVELDEVSYWMPINLPLVPKNEGEFIDE